MANNNQDLIQAKQLLFELNQLRDRLGREKLNLLDADLLKIAKDLPDDIKSARRELEGMADTMSGLYGSLRSITSEFKGQSTVINKVRGAFRQLESIAQDLKFDEQEINDLNASQLRKLEQKFKKNQEILNQEARLLLNNNNIAKTLDEEIEQYKSLLGPTESLSDFASAQIDKIQNLKDEEKALLKLYYDQGTALDDIGDKLQQRIQKEKEINDALGVGGAAVQGISTLMSSLGMSSGIFSEAVQEAEEAMRNTAKDGGSKLQVLMAGLGPLAKGFGKALTDPAVIIDKIISSFLEVNKQSVELERLTGQNSQAMAGANFEVATTVDVLKVAVALTEQLGVNAQNAFSSNVLAGAAGLTVEMGLAAEQAGGLAVMAQTTTGDINGMVDGIVATTSAFNKANRAAVSQGVVLKDVAKASDSIKLSLGNNPGLIAKAASAARRLGLELKDVDQIAGSLMNFEDSISAELEAELLTGKQLNLEKARELALKNDLAGLGDEIFKNSVDINEFGKMNRIQQESYAKALGLTKDQLARIAYQKAIEKGMTDEQAAAAAGVTAESMRQMDVQERISKAIDKLAQAFAPILDIVADIADVIGWIITPIAGLIGYVVKLLDTFGLIKIPLLFIGAIMLSGSVAKGIGSMVSGIGNFSKGILSAVKNFDVLNIKQAIFGKMYKGGQFMPGGGRAAAGGERVGGLVGNLKNKFKEGLKGKAEESTDKISQAGDKVAGSADKTKNVQPNAGKSIKQFLQGLAGGIRAFKTVSIADVGKVALAGLALLPLGLAAPGLFILSMIPGPKIRSALTGVGQGIAGLGKALSAGAPGILIGIGILALFGAALIPLTYALSLLSPIIEAFGKVITAVFGGIATLVTAVANGFVTMMGAVTMDSIGPMLLLGPALFGIAAGLGAIAMAGPMAIPALLSLTALGAVAGGITSIFGGGEEEKIGAGKEGEGDSSMKAVNEKLTTLINLVRDGQDIYLDANKVGRAQSLAVLKST
jgi:hypothetical protein